MAKNRISELDVAKISPLGVYANSHEALTIDPKYIKVITGDIVGQYLITGDSSYIDPLVEDVDYERPGVPHMDDIVVFKNSTYVDQKNNVRTKIVFRVKNSTGENIKGVDARLEVKTGDDQ